MDAGAVWMRAWLTFSALGLSIQPEMTPLIFADYARQGLIFSEEVRALERAGELRRALIHLLTEETTGRAVVMGRVGAGPAATARSLRRPLPEMLLQANAYPSDWKEL